MPSISQEMCKNNKKKIIKLTESARIYLLNRNMSLRRVNLISYCDFPISFVFPETTHPR